ncbi:MAG: Asd/ArgC dimerization domain-containing protein [Candidatus Aminicenantes bacterium]|nr:Asd/ArgC dimerization domain-containing protein [Candidatus Aminicenantes bacterium]
MTERKPFRVALVGTDSLRAQEIKNALAERRFPLTTIEFYDPEVETEYSKLTEFAAEPRVIHHLDFSLLEGLDLVFLAADEATNRRCGEMALERKFRAIDLHQTFSANESVPVVVAGVNDEIIIEQDAFLISNPHPVTIILSHLLHVLRPHFGLVRVLAFVMQPASAFGESGIEELANQSVSLLSSTSLKKKVFREQVAFNLLAPLDKAGPDGFTPDEKLIVGEVRRVLRAPQLPLSLSLIQVPVFHTYAIMTYFEFEQPVKVKQVEFLLQANSLFRLANAKKRLSVSSISVAGKDQIFIGQIKQEESFPSGLWIWAIADNLTLGSALNALEIARFIFNRRDEVSPVS